MERHIAIMNSLSIYTMLCTIYTHGKITLYNTNEIIEVAINVKATDYDIEYLQKKIKQLALAETNLQVLKRDGGKNVMVYITYDLDNLQHDSIQHFDPS